MNLTWHIVRKDVSALRWPLGFWLLCIVGKLGIGVVLLSASGEQGIEWFKQMETLAMGLAAAELLSFVLVAAWIQEDLMVGTNAFWMTRPIAGARLLRAKLLGIGLVFLVAPVLITLPWWLGCNYGPGEIAWAVAETVALHAIVVLLALLWSAVTDGLGRFLMWTLVTLAVVPMMTAVLTYYVARRNSGPLPELISARVMVALILVMTGIVVVLVHQYVTRRTWRSIGIVGSTLGLGVLVLAFWPWGWNLESRVSGYLIRRVQGDWPTVAEPPGLTFSLRSAEFAAQKDRVSRLGLAFRVEGLAGDQGLIAYPSEHFWHWPEGTLEEGYTSGRSVLNSIARNQATAFVKGEHAVDPWPGDDVRMISVLPSSTMAKVRAQPPAYTLRARLRLMKHEATTLVPLEAGRWHTEGTVGERIAAVEKSGDQMHVTFIRHAPSPWVDLVTGGQMVPIGRVSQHFLINRVNGWVDSGATLSKRATRIGTVEITWQTLFFHASSKGGAARPSLEAMNALNDAELIKVSYAEQARFMHEFQIDAVRITEANP